MKKAIMFAAIIVAVFATVLLANDNDLAEVPVSSKAISAGVCVEFYGADYNAPDLISAPKSGAGVVIGNINPGGWQVSLTQVGVGNIEARPELRDFAYSLIFELANFPVPHTRVSDYKIRTLRYDKYFNASNESHMILSVPVQSYWDFGIGAGAMEVRGTIEDKYYYDPGYWVVTPHYKDSMRIIDNTGVFGTVSLRTGIKTPHVGFTFVASKSFGGKVAGFSTRITRLLGNLTWMW